MIPFEWVEQASTRIAPHIQHTPLTYDRQLDCYIKWENKQVTGSFKARGALNRILSMQPWECEAGLVAASAGNHGQGVALAGKIAGAAVVIYASRHAAPVKLDAMRKLDADVRLVEGGYPEAEAAGMAYAASHAATWISPYNDGLVVAGQGTIALEVLQDLPRAGERKWLVPVSGGGLISGIGVVLKKHFPEAELIGVQAAASPFTHSLFYRGTQEAVQDLPSLADGLTGAIQVDSVTIPMMHKLVDEIVLVEEPQIEQAIAYAWHTHGEKIEGSGAVSLAAIMTGRINPPSVAVISGGNIQTEVHTDICSRFEGVL